ncbi:hypothetical protein [Spirulina sp. 06S082]|uniref:hypothetical protein n=1 Tax=Spirulina sp. 06S082 TaxID=3110248 RepID=UPI002B218E55|nr:hypothetical protein [Spirulina sp. 06S082]MEA5471831.1 hypothetical protein [Spirulina sp. 06S082]
MAKLPNKSWQFENPPNVAVLATTDVIKKGIPILYVSHDSDDGCWQFHSGSDVSVDHAMVVSLKKIVELDSSIQILADLPLGWAAIRESIEHDWFRFLKDDNSN